MPRRRRKGSQCAAAIPIPPSSEAKGNRSRIRGAALGLLAALCLGFLAWRYGRQGGGRLPRESGLDVVLISIDSLRADALGAYGRPDAGTPLVDRLAREGVRFEVARAHNVVTLPSHATLLSGRLPLAHGIRDNSGFRFPKDLVTLATLLKARGYRTGAFVSAFVLDSRFGLDRGFDVYDDHVGGSEGRQAFVIPERRGEDTVAAAASWLRAAGGQVPSFLFVHLYEPHAPYEPPEPFASRFRGSPYQGEAAAAAAALEPLLRPLLDGEKRRRTLVVLTSDHGEGLGEHGEDTHGTFGYESTLRVPLLLHAPGLLLPRVVKDAVRLVDVLPTVLDVLGFDAPPGAEGRSLLPLAAGGRLPEVETYFEALSASLDRGWAPLHGLVASPLKYVDLPIPELYDIAQDPREQVNLAARRPEDVARLHARLAHLRAGDAVRPRVAEDRAAVERLRALGYTGGSGQAALEGHRREDDPKALIALERREAEILRRFQAGDLEGARALCRQSLAERPSMSLTWTQLASIERARGALGEAVEAGRRALDLRPQDPATVALLGGVLVEAGRPEEARAVLAPLLAGDEPDGDVLIAEGMALARLGRAADALAVFDRARRLDPMNAFVFVNTGTVHLMAGRLAKARQAFAGALEVDPGSARAHNGLGVVAAREGQMAEALDQWKQAVALDAQDYRSLFNLGSTLRNQGRVAEARPYLEAYLRTAPEPLEPQDVARVRAWLRGGR